MSHENEQESIVLRPISGTFTIQAQLGDKSGKVCVINGNIYQDESPESINRNLDRMHDVLDRQRIRAEIPAIEAEIDLWRERLHGNKVHFALLIAKRDKGAKLSTQEKTQLEQMDVNVKEHLRQIEEGEKRLAEMRAKVATP